jgi:hypothetical protein
MENDEIIPMFPTDKDGKPLKKFQVRMRRGANGKIEKAIFIDDELLDWSVDMTSLMESVKMGPAIFRAAQKDIQKHFVESVSEFIGRKVTAEDVKNAIKTGWI